MIGRLFRSRRGTAAAELALILPMLLALMFGAMEAGHFFWTQHKIVKSVRDGARFASRLDVTRLCANDATLLTEIRNVTATGQLAGGAPPKVPGWTPATVNVTISCGSFVDTGIYTDLGGRGPLVTVSSGAVEYPSLFEALGFLTSDLRLSARSSTAVMGI
ncbi:TadE/TadG family type IV pilus assembly protein [Porphyrobacter sp. LM 6]|uniref:TadE/TadG family type IV pilus assembly protein n=1 Tax=Porphyrobacter sp. LM 6 TaxID=1896196 RepID=UPI000846A8DC|nr:TadE/TadG family type IV pilus assembly protein [Porphyrobacter sp. LM 6]AOL93191.1 Flp pilus assembly protein TadG [Porphyrobacter sp. LM 6]